jgi:cytochrome P450
MFPSSSASAAKMASSVTNVPFTPVGALQLFVYFISAFLLYLIGNSIYDVYFGPLSKFPGPKLWALTSIPRLVAQAAGNEPHTYSKLHLQYGETVRTGPREVSFATGSQAWKDIYGHKKDGRPQPFKEQVFYVNPTEPVPSILAANDANHTRVRRILAHAFSDKALKDQEPMLQKWMGLMAKKIEEQAQKMGKVDLVKIYNCASFDIMGMGDQQTKPSSLHVLTLATGELCFSESLNMLQDSEYSPWVKTIFSSIKTSTQFRSLRQYSEIFRYILDDIVFASEGAQQKLKEHQKYTSDRVNRRMEREPEHPDFWTKIMAKNAEEGGLSLDEHYSNASLFMMAGTETTATALAGATFHLLRNRSCLDKLTAEVRQAFTDLEDVTIDKAARLTYLHAVLQESMRLYPPLSIGMPRTTPEGGSVICGEFIPGNVTVSASHYATYRLEQHFKNALEFHPERWLGDEKYKNDHLDAAEVSHDWISACDYGANSGSVQPFQQGPRNCLGKVGPQWNSHRD